MLLIFRGRDCDLSAVEVVRGDWEPNREMARVRLLCWEVREAGGGSGRFGADVDYEYTLGLAGN